MVNRFDATLELSEFESVNANINSSAFTKIYKKKIPAKQLIAWGAGIVTAGGADLRETLKLEIKDSSGNAIDGKIRIAITDANEANSEFGKEFLASDLVSGKKLGFRSDLVVGEDAYLVVEMKSKSSSATIDFTKCSGSLPVTKELINNL